MPPPLHCRSCGLFDSRECPGRSGTIEESCDAYHSWSEHWTQEMVAIERALRNTYIAAACFAVLATATVILPTAFR